MYICYEPAVNCVVTYHNLSCVHVIRPCWTDTDAHILLMRKLRLRDLRREKRKTQAVKQRSYSEIVDTCICVTESLCCAL